MHKATRYYILAGLLGLGIACVVLSIGYYLSTKNNLINMSEEKNILFSQMLVNSIWKAFSPYINELQDLDSRNLRQHYIVKETGRTIRELANRSNVLEVSIYHPNGKAVYSSEFRDLGVDESSNPEFQQAVYGRIISSFEYRDLINAMDGLLLERKVVVTYFPVKTAAGDSLEGVMKIILDVSKASASVSNARTIAYFMIGIILFVNFAMFVFFVRRVNKVIMNQTTLIKNQNHHIEHRYFHDSLTQLPKLNIFYDLLQSSMDRAVAQEYLLAVIVVELGRLQKINDTLGYKYGDGLLLEASRRLKQCVRNGDVISRMGGDKFVITLTRIAVLYEVEEVVEQIQEAISEPYRVSDTDLFVSPSIGVSMYPFGDDDADTLIRKANSAMYKAKSTGNSVFRFYNPDVNQKVTLRFSLENTLRYALERDEFELHYQPVISLVNDNICALEALLRWRSPELGLVSPLEFIPLLEDTGLIKEVGGWVIEKACLDGVAWQQSGHPNLKINVNVSAVQFLQKEILRQANYAIQQSGINPYLLDLEITESILIDGIGGTLETLEELNQIGVSLSIDDFGTGYSSLAYLKRLPINTLKIDRAFIRDVNNNIDDAAIIDAICALSRNLRFKVIVEGVETMEQLSYLRGMRVNAVQGYLFCRPLPAEQVLGFLNRGITSHTLDPAG